MWQSLRLRTEDVEGEKLWCKYLTLKFGNRSSNAKGLRRQHEKGIYPLPFCSVWTLGEPNG